ncbi:MAG: cyclic nucleotide-binding domain-containing protein [Chloroflexi bacterium]|nr:MAG: cyclic nucleotide-binding domain-containing protein [Chloroflexota bacterium]TMC70190.1 MAG: cyclic nucleotide-binding domain-containing protein [Chloroflexota bacterium]
MKANGQLSSATRIKALRATRELAAYPDRRLQALLVYFDEVLLPAGIQVAREGKHCSEFVVVIDGRLQATACLSRTRTLGAGDSFGWNAMWKRASNEATVVVSADARLLVMSHSQFRAVKAIADPPE